MPKLIEIIKEEFSPAGRFIKGFGKGILETHLGYTSYKRLPSKDTTEIYGKTAGFTATLIFYLFSSFPTTRSSTPYFFIPLSLQAVDYLVESGINIAKRYKKEK